jgi:hypothetical protein
LHEVRPQRLAPIRNGADLLLARQDFGVRVGEIAEAYITAGVKYPGEDVISVIAPDARRHLGETPRTTISRLCLPNSKSIAANHVTACVAAVTGHVNRGIDRVYVLTQAISKAQEAIAAGCNRALALSV